MKRCDTCGEDGFHATDLVCLECEEVLENEPYLRVCWAGITLAAALHGGLLWLGFYPHFSIPEVIVLCAAIIAILYTVQKIVQMRRDPERPVIAEILSVYTDRSDRIFFILILAAAALVFAGLDPTTSLRRVPIDQRFATARFALTLYGFLFFTLWIFGSIRDQGVAFFDMRIANTCVDRERKKTLAAGSQS